MKNTIASLSLIAALAVFVPAVHAETVNCSTSQYGGAICGVETSTETKVEHKTVDAGIADWSIIQIIAFAGISAVLATVLYKVTYKSYILG